MSAPYICPFVIQISGTSPIFDSVNSTKYMILGKDGASTRCRLVLQLGDASPLPAMLFQKVRKSSRDN